MITKSISWKKMENVQGIFFFREVISFLAFFNKSEQKNLKFYPILDKYERSFLNWPFFPFLEWYKAVFFFNKKILYEFLKCEIQVLGKCHLEHYWIFHRRLCPSLHFTHDLISHLRFVHIFILISHLHLGYGYQIG